MTALSHRTEVSLTERSEVEMRCFDSADARHCRSWRLTMDEARDLASWCEHNDLAGPHAPSAEALRHGNVRVQIQLEGSSLDVRGFDLAGRPRLVGCSIPLHVLTVLCEALCSGRIRLR